MEQKHFVKTIGATEPITVLLDISIGRQQPDGLTSKSEFRFTISMPQLPKGFATMSEPGT
jgi:hypothetical protein